MMSGKAVGVRIELRDIRPKIWRRVVVPVSTTLYEIHETIQVAFGWENYHAWGFSIQDESFGPLPDGDEFWRLEIHDAMDFDLAWVISRGVKRFCYTYDFGDNWKHDVILGVVREVKKRENHPILVGGARNCPPEDFGGVSGYYALLDIIDDPTHESHEIFDEWEEGTYDPEKFDAELVRRELKRIRIEN